MKSIVVVSAGLSIPSSTKLLADKLAGATARAMHARGEEVDVRHVELRPLAHALTDHLLTGFGSAELAEAIAAVGRADGLVVVTPVFSASYSGLFKTFFDVLEPGTLDGTAVLIAATAGTARHSLVLEHAMRPLFAYLRALTLPTSIYAAPEDWEPLEGMQVRIDAPLVTGIRAIDGLLTCGRGQRMGIFAGSGVGKSVLMGMMLGLLPS